MERICKLLGYFNFEIVEAKGLAGGLAFMWKAELEMKCLWKTSRVICCSLKGTQEVEEWRMIGCYGTPYYREKELFWDALTDSLQMEQVPWLLFGDLNEVTSETEKFGGRSIWKRRLFLKNFLQEVNGIDLGFSGRKWQG